MVALIMTLFVAMAAASFQRSYHAMGQARAVENLQSLMRLAHERAVLEGVRYAVRLEPAQQRVRLVRLAAATDLETPVAASWAVSSSWPAGDFSVEGESRVMFYPDGTATAATLTWKGDRERIALSIHPLTGRAVRHETL